MDSKYTVKRGNTQLSISEKVYDVLLSWFMVNSLDTDRLYDIEKQTGQTKEAIQQALHELQPLGLESFTNDSLEIRIPNTIGIIKITVCHARLCHE